MNTDHFEKRLLDKERELLANVGGLDDEARTSGEPEVRDPTDDATSDQGTSESLEEETVASQELVEVQDAVRRIATGTYGKCVVCGRQIPEARLEAIPWTPFCLEDQQKQDKAAHVRQGGSTL